MCSIVFMFSLDSVITNTKSIQYGKILLNYPMYEDHLGIDTEIRPAIIKSINSYRSNHSLSKIHTIYLGVVGFLDTKCWCSKKERDFFTLYIDCSDDDWRKHRYYYCGEEESIVLI